MWWWPTLQKEGEEGEKMGEKGREEEQEKEMNSIFKNNEFCLDFVVTEDKHACVKYTVQ